MPASASPTTSSATRSPLATTRATSCRYLGVGRRHRPVHTKSTLDGSARGGRPCRFHGFVGATTPSPTVAPVARKVTCPPDTGGGYSAAPDVACSQRRQGRGASRQPTRGVPLSGPLEPYKAKRVSPL